MKTPQVKPSWDTGIYIGNGVIAKPTLEELQIKGLKDLIQGLEKSNKTLKLRLWEYENNYRMGKFPK
tara:strand:- start:414 stop:614 length:201 start_codon:yes stop_codon:yes gene_type:complete